MRKLFATIISIIVISIAIQQPVFAAELLSIRLEQPKTPTNQQLFDITFVTLDLMGRDVTVMCYKQGPGDASFIQFGASQTFTNGGNTGICTIDSSIVNTKGNYTFKVVATAGSDSKEDTAGISYTNDGPGDPTGYSKDRVNLCDYKIKFHSADDNGRTIKIEVYRSENKTFTADTGSRVDTIFLGSNIDGQSITTPPSCDKNYYFAIRAFDSAGNGSSLVGDSETTVTTTTTTTGATPKQGAIVLTTSSEGSVLGKESTASEEGKVLGLETPTTKPTATLKEFLKNNGILIFGILLFVIGIIGLYVSKKKKSN